MTNGGGTLTMPASHVVECFGQVPLRSRRQIWCFAHGGAGAAEFHSWPSLAGPDILICAVRLPGRERRLTEPLLTDMRHASRAIAREIGDLVSCNSVFYGQCLGAMLAFEVVAELERAGSVLPERVYVASQVAPQWIPHDAATDILSDQDSADFRNALLALGGIPPELMENDEIWEIVEPALRADSKLIGSYKATSISDAIAAPITALLGADDIATPRDGVEHWRFMSSRSFTLQLIQGGRFLSQSSSAEIIRIIKEEWGQQNAHG